MRSWDARARELSHEQASHYRGSDAGISAALCARENDGVSEITVVVADRFPNYSVCGLPSSEVPDWHRLAHHEVTVTNGDGQVQRLA